MNSQQFLDMIFQCLTTSSGMACTLVERAIFARVLLSLDFLECFWASKEWFIIYAIEDINDGVHGGVLLRF